MALLMMTGLIMINLVGCSESGVYHDKPIYKGPARIVRDSTYSASRDSATWNKQYLISKQTIKLDDQGRMTEKIKYGPDGKSRERYTYSYREDGRPKEEKRYNNEQKLTHIKKYSYSWIKDEASVRVLDPDGNLKWKETHVYDGNGKLIDKRMFGPDGSLNLVIKYSYDDQGRLSKEDGVNHLFYTYKKVDDQGNWTRRLTVKNKQEEMLTLQKITYKQ